MTTEHTWSERQTRLMNRWHARLAALSRPATAFNSTPEPRTIGSFARGRQVIEGNLLFAGHLVEAPGRSIWDIDMPSAEFEAELHGFTWIDDLFAVGDARATQLAQGWTHDWIRRYGRGSGPGWTPDLTGRRLIRWINHAIPLLIGQDPNASRAYFRTLGRQVIFLSRRWPAASPGLPRFEALTGLIYAGIALSGMDGHVATAARALDEECGREIDPTGALVTRNPEELLEVFTLLNWAADALRDAGRSPGARHLGAIASAAPVLRALRHADGGLARFHGGGRGLEGRLERALALSGVRDATIADRAMGYARVSHGRTSVIMDAALPPSTPNSASAHASTLAFELTSGRRPLIVNCGSGATFGESWRRAGRATPSHSTLGIDGYSSSRLGQVPRGGGGVAELLIDGPGEVRFDRAVVEGGTRIVAGHDGYADSHGLTHVRSLHLGKDGRRLAGEDSLICTSEQAQRRFGVVFDRARMQGISYAIRFHLHPDVDATLDMGGTAISMALKSGEVWVFQARGDVTLALESSVFLEKSRLSPRASKQIVLTGEAMEYSTRVSWTLAKAAETPIAVRDHAMEDMLALE